MVRTYDSTTHSMVVSGTPKVRDRVGSAMLTTLTSSVAINVPSASAGNTRQRGYAGSDDGVGAVRAAGRLIPRRSGLAHPAHDLREGRGLPVHQQSDAEQPRGTEDRQRPGPGEQRHR